MGTPSWIILEKETGRVVAETFRESNVKNLDKEKYEAIHIMDYLVSLNNPEPPK